MKLHCAVPYGAFLSLSLLLWSCQNDPASSNPTNPTTWQESTPVAQGLDSQTLDAAFEEGSRRPFIRGLVVARNGYLVAERYYRGLDKDDHHNVKSISKSFLSAMVGIALRDSILTNLDQKMLDYFAENVTTQMDQRLHQVTPRHLLMMRMGIEHERNNYMQIYNSRNWIQTTIDWPLTYNPGTRFSYNTFQTHLLSVILTKTTGRSTLAFGKEVLMEPLGIRVHEWEKGPQGYYFGGNSMRFTTRDIAWFGQLYLRGGKLRDEQIVPADWVTLSLQNNTGNNDWTWGELNDIAYGYLWWMGELKGYTVKMAIGFGGQFVMLFPELDMVVATNSESDVGWDTADAQEQSVVELVANYILPAVN